MGNGENIRIDGAKLKEELKKAGYDMKSASVKIGMARNYFTNVIARGYVKRSTAIMLENVMGIKQADYEIREPEPAPAEKAVKQPETAFDGYPVDLYSLIYKAVKDAILDAKKQA